MPGASGTTPFGRLAAQLDVGDGTTASVVGKAPADANPPFGAGERRRWRPTLG